MPAPLDNPCTRCGACCASFRVDFARDELDEEGGPVPSGLVVDVTSDEEKPHPRPVLDNDYEIRPCNPDPQESPEQNRAEAERDQQLEFQLES